MSLPPRRGFGQAAATASDAAGRTIAAILAQAARLRAGKAVHPHGVTYRARFCVDGTVQAPSGSELLSRRAEWPALVRFSRSVGVPRPLPDLLGMSIRVLGAYGEERHQDFLMVTSVDLPVLHHIFLPARDLQQRPYSSSLPYESGGRTFLVGARSHPDSPRPRGGDEFDRLDEAVGSGRLRFDFLVAPVRGRFERVGEVRIGPRLSADIDALRFNPFNTGDDLEPVGTFNRWRREAYPLSQRAWGTMHEKAIAQDRAEAQMRAFHESAEPPTIASVSRQSAGASR